MERFTFEPDAASERDSRSWVFVLLYNAFVAIWVVSMGLGFMLWPHSYPERPEYGRHVADLLDVVQVLAIFIGVFLLALLLLVWRRIPAWFRAVLCALALIYIVAALALISRLQPVPLS